MNSQDYLSGDDSQEIMSNTTADKYPEKAS